MRRILIVFQRVVFVIIFVFFFVSPSFSQNAPTHFVGLRCKGEMPADLRKDIDQLYTEDKQRVRDYTGGKLTNGDKVKDAAYYISLLMSSGRILYGDTITRTIERIADTLLKDNPELRRELRFYTVKSTDVNAFATGQGMVFVNLGLMAKVRDEAQLAFVLSHEIVHYQRKHNLENMTRKCNRCDTTKDGINEFVRYHNRSRQMESEADSLGVEYFYKNSRYDKMVTDGFFDVLQYGYLPFDEVPFDTTRFDSPYFKLSSGTFLETVKPVSARDDYNDSLSTHPNLKKRREATMRQLAGFQTEGAKYLVTTASEFDFLRNLARFECIRIDLADAEFASAYYNSDVLLRQMPDNEFLLVSRAQALYGAAKFRNYSASANITDSKDMEGEVQQAYHFMRRGKPVELNIVALREVWKTHNQMPGNVRLMDMAADLAYDLKYRNNLNADVFVATVDIVSNNVQDTTIDNEKNGSRRSRRRQKQVNLYRNAFIDIMMTDSNFKPFLMQWSEKTKVQVSADDNKGALIFDPTCFVYNDRNEQMKLGKTIDKQKQMTEDLLSVGNKCFRNIADFSDPAMRSKGQTDFYNDFMTICEWSNEFYRTNGNVPMFFASQSLMDSLMMKYDVDKLLISRIINAENVKKSGAPWILAAGAITVLLFPEAVYSVFFQHEETGVRNRIVSTQSGMFLDGEQSWTNTDDSRAFYRSQTYSQIKGDKCKNPGYLGRHLSITANGGVSFPIFGRLFERPNVDVIALRWGGGLEYAITRQSSLALFADYSSTTFDIRNEPIATANAGITTVALTYRMYSDDHVAPLGNYFGVGAAYSKLNLQSTTNGAQFRYIEKENNYFAIHFEAGRNFILTDWIVLNIGARYNLTLANPLRVFENSHSFADMQKDTQRSVNANLFMYNMISLNVSLGFIPF